MTHTIDSFFNAETSGIDDQIIEFGIFNTCVKIFSDKGSTIRFGFKDSAFGIFDGDIKFLSDFLGSKILRGDDPQLKGGFSRQHEICAAPDQHGIAMFTDL